MKTKDSNGRSRSKILSHAVLVLSFIVIFTLTYLQAIHIDYLFMDDYAFVKTTFDSPKTLKEEIIDRSGEGKVIYGIFLHFISEYINHAKLIRLLGITDLSILAFLIYNFLVMCQVNKKHAFLISILVCTLLPFQLFVAWLVTAPYVISALLSVAAAIISYRSYLARNTQITVHTLRSVLASVFLLLIALHIYQPTAMIYWSIGIIPLSFLGNDDLKGRWYLPYGLYLATGFVALSVYFLTIKVLHFALNVGFPGRGGLIGPAEIFLKLKWFFYCPLNYALNLWNMFPTYGFAGVIGIIILVFFITNIFNSYNNDRRIRSLWKEVLRVLLFVGFLLLSYLPNLLVKDNVPAYRTLVSLVTGICFLMYFGIVTIVNLLKFVPGFRICSRDKTVTFVLSGIALIVSYQAHNNVNDFARLQLREMEYIKSILSSSELSRITEIYVKRPDENKIIESGFLYDEFGRPTTSVRFGPPRVLKVALDDLGINSNIKINQGASDESVPEGESVLVIDMTNSDLLNNFKSGITGPQRYCLTFPKRLN